MKHALTFWIEKGTIHVGAACHHQDCDLARSIAELGCSDFIECLIDGESDSMGMIEIGTLGVEGNDDWEFRFTDDPHADARRILNAEMADRLLGGRS